VQQVIEDELKSLQTQTDGLRVRVLGGFNNQLRDRNLPIIVVPSPK
jgi:hypothetical protein